VLGHDDVAQDDQPIAAANAFEHSEEQVAFLGGSQEWLPAIATGGKEMQVSRAVVAGEFLGIVGE